ncbi:hypothetical protein [Variovorax sp. dw_954]|uniref:hypothetical protein n=1 Tax=Variovorax sp. dw_954 TaxID=2720078 RepID=UPI001BD3BDD9|nr:hypothetical protein [Variovorax sp. dw_954]
MTGYLQRLVSGAGTQRPRLRPLAGPPDGVVVRDPEEHLEERATVGSIVATSARTAASDSRRPPRDEVRSTRGEFNEAMSGSRSRDRLGPTASPAHATAELPPLPFMPVLPANRLPEADREPARRGRARTQLGGEDDVPRTRADAADPARPPSLVVAPASMAGAHSAAAATRAPEVAARAASVNVASIAARGVAHEERDIEIRIGRIEVVAVPEVRQPQVAAPAPRRAQSLDDYLTSRARGSR